MSREEFRYGPDGERQYVVAAPAKPAAETDARNKEASSVLRAPWSREVDRALFHRESRVSRFSAAYYEFQEFYERYRMHEATRTLKPDVKEIVGSKAQQLQQTPGEHEDPTVKTEEQKHVEFVLALYHRYQEQKRQSAVQSIAKERRNLPVKEYEQEIVDTVRRNPVTIIAADTGAGKSTQVPQYLLEAGFERIACTQPRRIACISLAKRVAHETGNSYGAQIAYQVRFDGTQTEHTRILFLTEGLLLRQYSGDSLLSRYDVIIVDEVHERHAMGDFLLGILKRLIHERPTLKLVLMSATINAELFSNYFHNAPLIQVPGKLFPVEIEYLPAMEEDRQLTDPRLHRERMSLPYRQSIPAKAQYPDPKPYIQILERIDRQVPRTERGDMLIFLSGINEITALADELQIYASQNRRWIVLKLHSSLSLSEQDKVFGVAPEGVRKCILSTNIAETSVTIDGIRFIVDSGRVKELDYDLGSNLSRLSEFWIAKSSAKQRTGRAGRTGPGQCFRLYSKREFEHLNDFPVPEIMRGPLASLVLQMKAMDLGDPLEFDFLEKPPPAHLHHAVRHLRLLGALSDDKDASITQLGYTLSHLPIDAILGKMLVLAAAFDVVEPILIMAAGLSITNSPFLRLSPEAQTMANRNRAELISEHGDPFTLWNIYNRWMKVKLDKRENSRRWCRQRGIEEQRLYEMVKLIHQFRSILKTHLANRFEKADMEAESLETKGVQRKRTTRDRVEAFAKLQRLRSEQMDSSSRGKQLKMQDTSVQAEGVDVQRGDEEEDEEDDVHALEFTYRNDRAAADEESQHIMDVDSLSPNQLTVLKLILCSGLYPNLAFPDPSNHSRKESDQMFHTRQKRFVLIHPTSIFVSSNVSLDNRTHSMTLDAINAFAEGDLDIATSTADDKPPQQLVVSHLPEFLCYLQLMETYKPYLMNLFRVPALHAALLFGRHIDTNRDGTMLVVDDWIVLEFKNVGKPFGRDAPTDGESEAEIRLRVTNMAMAILSSIVRIRRHWAQLVLCRLSASRNMKRGLQDASQWKNEISAEVLKEMHPGMRAIYSREQKDGTIVADALAEQEIRQTFLVELERLMSVDGSLMTAGVGYSVDTLRETDLDVLFPGSRLGEAAAVMTLPTGWTEKPRVKSGVQITPFLRYASVDYPPQQPSSEATAAPTVGERKSMRTVWECPRCHKAWMVTEEDRRMHLSQDCTTKTETKGDVSEVAPVPPQNSSKTSCKQCGVSMEGWSPIDMLRHKKRCGKE